MAQALPLLELGRGSRDTSGGPFVPTHPSR